MLAPAAISVLALLDGRVSELAKTDGAHDVKRMPKAPSKHTRSAKTGQYVAGKPVLGTTKDGVRILKPNGRATHFTPKELRDAVASVMASKRAG